MVSNQMQGVSLTVSSTEQERVDNGIMSSCGEPNRQVGGCKGLQRMASKDINSIFGEGSFGNAPQCGGLGLQRTMSKNVGAEAQQTVPGGGLQRTMSRDMGGPQPGGLQRTMSRNLGPGPQPGGLQRTMSRDLDSAQPSGGGLQRTMSRGMGNLAVPRDASRQRRKTRGTVERIPKSTGC